MALLLNIKENNCASFLKSIMNNEYRPYGADKPEQKDACTYSKYNKVTCYVMGDHSFQHGCFNPDLNTIPNNCFGEDSP